MLLNSKLLLPLFSKNVFSIPRTFTLNSSAGLFLWTYCTLKMQNLHRLSCREGHKQRKEKERYRVGVTSGKEQIGQLELEERCMKKGVQRESKGCHSSDFSSAKRSSTAAVWLEGHLYLQKGRWRISYLCWDWISFFNSVSVEGNLCWARAASCGTGLAGSSL